MKKYLPFSCLNFSTRSYSYGKDIMGYANDQTGHCVYHAALSRTADTVLSVLLDNLTVQTKENG